MKHAVVEKLILSMWLFLLMLLSNAVGFSVANAADFAPGEIAAELKTKLDLNAQQEQDLTAALTELGKKLDELIAKREAAKEEDDPDAFIQGIKQVQADYQKKLKTILTPAQMDGYNALRETVIMDMMKDLAEIKLLDIQPHVQFSDEQLQQLVPVLAESMRGFMKIAWKYAGERLRLGQKIKVAKELKRIQSKAQQQVQQTLTGEQYKKWEEYKQQQQSKGKAA